MKRKLFSLIGAFVSAMLLFAFLPACSAAEPVSGNGSGASSGTAGGDTSEASLDDGVEIEFDSETYEQILDGCVRQIRQRTDFEPEVAIVLGSGLGHFADRIDVVAEIPFAEIAGFPDTTVNGHEGRLVFGTLNNKNVVAMQGRVHYYEGYSVQDVVTPLRVLYLLGADTVIITNAAGAINADYQVGDFAVAQDHISLFVPSPLEGENIDKLGVRFPDMTAVYDKDLVELACSIGKEHGFSVHRATLVQTTGPQFETPAEIEMLRGLGADTVCMSSVIEAIAARHMGMRVCTVSCITNMAAGMQAEVTDEEVKDSSKAAAEDFTALVSGLVAGVE